MELGRRPCGIGPELAHQLQSSMLTVDGAQRARLDGLTSLHGRLVPWSPEPDRQQRVHLEVFVQRVVWQITEINLVSSALGKSLSLAVSLPWGPARRHTLVCNSPSSPSFPFF
jgi:hypothetical protein